MTPNTLVRFKQIGLMLNRDKIETKLHNTASIILIFKDHKHLKWAGIRVYKINIILKSIFLKNYNHERNWKVLSQLLASIFDSPCATVLYFQLNLWWWWIHRWYCSIFQNIIELICNLKSQNVIFRCLLSIYWHENIYPISITNAKLYLNINKLREISVAAVYRSYHIHPTCFGGKFVL